MIIYALKEKDSNFPIPEHLFQNLEEVDDFLNQPDGYSKSHLVNNNHELVNSDKKVYEVWVGIQ